MVSFGSKAGSSIRQDLKNASGNGSFLRTLQDGKDLRVRFLQDPEDWYKYKEHYSQATKFFPCTQDDTCPGCNSDSEQLQRASKRYAASVLDVEQGKVIPLKMPIDLANRVTNKCDRNGGTLLDRDFTLIRTGKGMNDTTYDVEAEDKTQVDLSRYEKIDIEAILAASYNETFGDNPNPDPVVDTSPQATIVELQKQLQEIQQRAAAEPPKVQSGPVTLSVPGATPMEQKKNLEESGMPTASPEPTPTTGGDDGFVSMEQLQDMDGDTLRRFVADNGLTPPAEAFDKDSLLTWLLSEFGVE